MSIYMKFGSIEGPVTLKGFEKHSELVAMQHETSRQIHSRIGDSQNLEASKPHLGPVIISKMIDKTSPELYQESLKGQSTPQVDIAFVTTGDNSEYLRITLHDVVISKYEVKKTHDAINQIDGSDPNTKPMETLALSFSKIEYKYTPYDDKNKQQSPFTASYDARTAVVA